MTPVRCVVFDVDDTLFLERDYVRSGFEALDPYVRERVGLEGFSARAFAAFEQGTRRTIFEEVLATGAGPPDPALIWELVERYRTHAPRIVLLPDAKACLGALKGRVALAGITDGPRQSQRAKTVALGLEAWLDPILFTDELGPEFGKPNPRAFELVEVRTSCRAAECVYLADNPAKDFGAPRLLGWRTVRVRRPLGLHCAVASAPDVELEVDTLTDIPRLLELVP